MLPFIHRSGLLPLGVLVGFGLCYADVIGSILETWSRAGCTRTGFVVPVISGYLLWAKRHHLQTLPRTPDYVLGPAIILLGISLLLVGQLAMATSVEQFSLLVTLIGCTLCSSVGRG